MPKKKFLYLPQKFLNDNNSQIFLILIQHSYSDFMISMFVLKKLMQTKLSCGHESISVFIQNYLNQHPFPLEEEIKKQFNYLNQTYKFFELADIEFFGKVYKTCKLLADLFLNVWDLSHHYLYLQAYKILVICGATKDEFIRNFRCLIKTFNAVNYYLLNELLSLIHLPTQLNKQSLAFWRALIFKTEMRGIRYFRQSTEIEIYLNRMPKDFEEVVKVYAHLTYRQYAINPKLAILCAQYNIPNKLFAKMLSIKTAIKDKGKAIHSNNVVLLSNPYVWVKLNKADRHIPLLGYIIPSELYIGGVGESKLLEAYENENQQFYVLLKKRHNDDGCLLDKNQQLITKNYKMIAYGIVKFVPLSSCIVLDEVVAKPNLSSDVLNDLVFKLAVKVLQDSSACAFFKRDTLVHVNLAKYSSLSPIGSPSRVTLRQLEKVLFEMAFASFYSALTWMNSSSHPNIFKANYFGMRHTFLKNDEFIDQVSHAYLDKIVDSLLLFHFYQKIKWKDDTLSVPAMDTIIFKQIYSIDFLAIMLRCLVQQNKFELIEKLKPMIEDLVQTYQDASFLYQRYAVLMNQSMEINDKKNGMLNQCGVGKMQHSYIGQFGIFPFEKRLILDSRHHEIRLKHG